MVLGSKSPRNKVIAVSVVPCSHLKNAEEGGRGKLFKKKRVMRTQSAPSDLAADKKLMEFSEEMSKMEAVRRLTMQFKDGSMDHEYHATMFSPEFNGQLRTNFIIMSTLWAMVWANYIRLFLANPAVWVLGAATLLSMQYIIFLTFKSSPAWGRVRQYATMVSLSLCGTSVCEFSRQSVELRDHGKDASASQETAQLTAIYMLCVLCVVASGFCNLRTTHTFVVELVFATAFIASTPWYADLAQHDPYQFARNVLFLVVLLAISFVVAGQNEHRRQKLFLHNRKLVQENNHIRAAADRLRAKMAIMETQVRATMSHLGGVGGDRASIQAGSLESQMEEMATDGTLFQVFMKSQEKDASPEIKKQAKDVLERFMSVAEDTDAPPQIQMAASAIEVARMWMNRMGVTDISRDEMSVFLGGSCNPTTWRVDRALPFFDKADIKCYNPQVEEWYPELAVEEANAKEEAFVLFFVIDRQTRALASVLEATEHICRGRVLVLVIEDVAKNSRMSGSVLPIDDKQCDDLNRARAYLRDVCDRHGVCYYTSVEDGCRAVMGVVHKALHTPEGRASIVKMRRQLSRRGSKRLQSASSTATASTKR